MPWDFSLIPKYDLDCLPPVGIGDDHEIYPEEAEEFSKRAAMVR